VSHEKVLARSDYESDGLEEAPKKDVKNRFLMIHRVHVICDDFHQENIGKGKNKED
jgi:hypothetical protein